jgi:GAF domain-containing protein
MVDGAIGGLIETRSPPRSGVEARLSDSERQLAAEVEDLKRLHALSLRLTASSTLADVLNDVLRTAASLVDARLGSVQLLAPEGSLGMVGQIGFGESILDEFAVVRLEDCSTCVVALQRRSRVAVRDLRSDPKFTEIAAALRSYGAVAAVSTPVLDSGGKVLAMFSVYWLEEHEPSDRELRVLDLCADLAGRHIERSVAEALSERAARLQALANTYRTLTDEAPESAQLHEIVSAGQKSHSEQADIR